MGAVANVVKNKASGLSKVEAFGMQSQLKAFRGNAVQGLGGSKVCPVVSEVRDVVEGITQGDFSKSALATGLLGAFGLGGSTASSGKFGIASKGAMTANAAILGCSARLSQFNGSGSSVYNLN